MTLDKESRLAMRAEARAIYQEFKRLGGDSTEVKARRAELERRYHEINAMIAGEREQLTAEAERIPIELAAILGNDPEDQAERGRLMTRYEEIHAILKKRPKSFEKGSVKAAPDADEAEVATWDGKDDASETVLSTPADLSLAGLDSGIEPTPIDSGAQTVIGQAPVFDAPLEAPETPIFDGPLEEVSPVVEETASNEPELPEAAEEVTPEETVESEEKEPVGLAALSLDDLMESDEISGDTEEDLGQMTALAGPEDLKSDAGAADRGVSWSEFDSSGDKDEDDGDGEGWVLPALSEEPKSSGTASDAWESDDDDGLPPLSDFEGKDPQSAFGDDPLLNITSIGDSEVQRKRDDIPLPQDNATDDNALWQDLSGENKG